MGTGARKGRRHLGQTKAALKGRWWHEGQKVSGMEVLGGGCTGHEEMIQEGKIVFCTGQMNDTGLLCRLQPVMQPVRSRL